MTIGISSAGISVPIRRLPVIDTVSQWNNTSADLIVKQFGTECRTSLGSDEDTLTLAHEASHNCMDNARADPSDVDAVFFGTVTAPELYRGCANALMDMLTASNAYTSQDVSAAERSGIMALTNAYAYISSGLAHQALAVGSDSLCRHTAPGDLRESYEGAGAGALLISDQNVIAEIFKVSSCNSNFPEFDRPEDERYIRGLMPMDSGTTHIGMMRHITTALQRFMAEQAMTVNDFNYVILPQEHVGQSLQLARHLHIDKERILPTLFASTTGDLGSAGPLIALAKVLEICEPGSNILLCAYGHNAGADVLGLTATEHVTEYQRNLVSTVTGILDETINVKYPIALKNEYKLSSPNITIGTFN